MGRRGYFVRDPRSAPIQGLPPLIAWTGLRFSPPVLTGSRLGNSRGKGQGQGTLKITAAPCRSVGRGGELRLGPAVFGAPEFPQRTLLLLYHCSRSPL